MACITGLIFSIGAFFYSADDLLNGNEPRSEDVFNGYRISDEAVSGYSNDAAFYGSYYHSYNDFCDAADNSK